MADKYKVNRDIPLKFIKGFLDDIIMIWRGSLEYLHLFLKDINKINPTIKFTMDHLMPGDTPAICDCALESPSIPFLDTAVSIENNTIITDLYRKETDCNVQETFLQVFYVER